MCIYYTTKTSLHYASREHIIPAAIGGKLTLDKGVVSDEFNNDISKLEDQFIHNFLSIPRELLGPGKRGSLNPKHASKSSIYLFNNPNDDNYSFGYMINGRPHEISHIVVDTRTGAIKIRVPSSKGQNGFAEFKVNAMSIGNSSIKILNKNVLPESIVLFGIDQNKKGKKFIFAKRESNSFIPTAESIYKIFEAIEIPNQGFEKLTYRPKVHSDHVFDIEYFRIFGKIAFNYLAKLKGKEFVQHATFDPVRNWISNGGVNTFASLDTINMDHLSKLIEWKVLSSVPDSYHFISIRKVDTCLVANVLLYTKFGAQIILSKDFNGYFADDSFICDWKNQKEFGLIEFLATELHKQGTH